MSDNMRPNWWERSAPMIAATVRVLGAIVLAYMFVVVLMTAIAQSEVIAKLKGDYSAAYAELNQAEAVRPELERKMKDQTQAARAVSAAERTQQSALIAYSTYAAPIERVARQTQDTPCDVGPIEQVVASTIGSVITALEQCIADAASKIPASTERAIKAIAAERTMTLNAASMFLSANDRLSAAKTELADQVNGLSDLRAIYENGAQRRGPFSSVLVMKDKWLLGGGVLVQFPPSMMQVLIAFFSGTFGALLLALVLIVYPNTDLGLTKPGGNYGERILLGGLIAVCVYIVLGGGTAVLGTSAGANGETMNFQAFSAIGVLAGMFSDRVAQWLSRRADVFYGDRTRKAHDVVAPIGDAPKARP